jgi:hypothetical protein
MAGRPIFNKPAKLPAWMDRLDRRLDRWQAGPSDAAPSARPGVHPLGERAAAPPPPRAPPPSQPVAKKVKFLPTSEATAGAEANYETARALGVVAALSSTHEPDAWLAEPSDAERDQAVRLRLALSARAGVANAPTYHSELRYALGWLTAFRDTMPHRVLVRRYLDAGDSMYNADTRGMLFEYMRETGSRRGGASHGKVLKSDTISGVLSTLFAYFERIAGGPLSAAGALSELAQARKQARQEDGPPGERAKEEPLRAMHLRAAFTNAEFDVHSAAGVVRRAGLLAGHNLLARARCLSAGFHDSVDPTRDLTIASFDWEAGRAMSPPAVVVWLHPSKDPTQRKRRYPMLIQRRHTFADSEPGADPMCTFDALAAAWPILAATVPPANWASTLFFRIQEEEERHPRNWRPLRTSDVASWVDEAAQAAGLPPKSRGTRALRMGGASDMYDLYGPAGERYIRERGRWGSDVAQIYQRVSAAAHGAISRAIGGSTGIDLQSMLSGWCQTAVSHGRCPA